MTLVNVHIDNNDMLFCVFDTILVGLANLFMAWFGNEVICVKIGENIHAMFYLYKRIRLYIKLYISVSTIYAFLISANGYIAAGSCKIFGY